jgi:hypothetical protein
MSHFEGHFEGVKKKIRKFWTKHKRILTHTERYAETVK